MRWTRGQDHEGLRLDSDRPLAAVAVSLAITIAAAGLASPLLSSQQEDAAKARSMKNIQALARATRMYRMDWGGTFPGWQRNPDGTYAHNVWDQQIFHYVGKNDAYTNGRPGGIRSWADPEKRRVISYGMNGYLLCTPYVYNGSIQTTAGRLQAGADRSPKSKHFEQVRWHADTIMLAELATERPVSPSFTAWNKPVVADQAERGSAAWEAAMDHWIDISPREWVENNSPIEASYTEGQWTAASGVARDLYGGGANYAFVDGHAEFLSISETVGLGMPIHPEKGAPYEVTPGANAWRADNPVNRWNPGVEVSTGRERGVPSR